VNLVSLTIADYYSFYNCTSLSSLNLPALDTVGDSCFYNCTALLTIDLPLLTTCQQSCFSNCYLLTSISLPSCTDLGGTVLDDAVFVGIIGSTISATFNSILETCDAGNPDGDIQYLSANNTVTISYV
jgi:hypothetical protein